MLVKKQCFLYFLVILFPLMGCGDCYKNYLFNGTVKDATGFPLKNVSVSMNGAVFATTGEDGNYSYRSESTRTWYSERYITFSKNGYKTADATSYSETEAGPEVCGDVTLTRNATLDAE